MKLMNNLMVAPFTVLTSEMSSRHLKIYIEAHIHTFFPTGNFTLKEWHSLAGSFIVTPKISQIPIPLHRG